MSEKDPFGRKEPPEENEWPRIWRTIERAEMAWVIIAPIHAIVSNWKALAAIAVVLAWLNSPEIIALLSAVTGVGQ